MSAPVLVTSRLCLRPWRDADLPVFAELNADTRVMACFPSTLNRGDSDALAARIRLGLETQPYGLWAVEIPGVADFAGFLGLSVPSFDAPFMPAIEIGWRLAWPQWGHGYATEGAREVLRYAFESLNLATVVSFTARENARSVRVMQRIGLHHDPSGDFEHPRLPEAHPLRPHVLYRLGRTQWIRGDEA